MYFGIDKLLLKTNEIPTLYLLVFAILKTLIE